MVSLHLDLLHLLPTNVGSNKPFDKVCPLLGATIHGDRTTGAIDAFECLAYSFYMNQFGFMQ